MTGAWPVVRAGVRAGVRAAAIVLLRAPAAPAQRSAAPQPVLRADAIVGATSAVQGGVGLAIPLGIYVRLDPLVAGGGARVDGRIVGSARAEAVARFLLDPLRESAWGLSIGGGVTERFDVGRGWRPFLTVVADLEGPRRGGWSPAVQLGLGGGGRIGLLLRRSVSGQR